MKVVPFTQYFRPSGRKEAVQTHVGDSLTEKVNQILAAGYHFTCEVISQDGGLVAFTISDGDWDYATELSTNSQMVTEKIEEMIRKFDFDAAKQMKEYMEGGEGEEDESQGESQ